MLYGTKITISPHWVRRMEPWQKVSERLMAKYLHIYVPDKIPKNSGCSMDVVPTRLVCVRMFSPVW